jgi:carbamoyl-phosphate synthase large subunit
VLARIPTITTIAAARAAAEGIHAMQLRQTTVYALQHLHAATCG